MKRHQTTKLTFKVPRIYKPKILKFQSLTGNNEPISFVNTICNLKGLNNIIIIHKPLKLAAEFELPNKILVDFRNSLNYISLCLAHEYVHILLKNKISIPYSIEQSLAILIQLSYEDFVNIRKFNQKTARELMELMNVWSVGKILLKNWPSYWNLQTGRNKKYINILIWLRQVIKSSNIKEK